MKNKIYCSYLSSYLEGIMNMASSLSKSIGYSYIKVHGYENGDETRQHSGQGHPEGGKIHLH